MGCFSSREMATPLLTPLRRAKGSSCSEVHTKVSPADVLKAENCCARMLACSPAQNLSVPGAVGAPEVGSGSSGSGVTGRSQGKTHGLKITLPATNTSMATVATSESPLPMGLAEGCAGRAGRAGSGSQCSHHPAPGRVPPGPARSLDLLQLDGDVLLLAWRNLCDIVLVWFHTLPLGFLFFK